MKSKSTKIRFNKKYIAFFACVPILLIFSSLTAKCPVCEGTGHLSSTPDMKYVQLISSDFKELQISRDVCTTYIVYSYTITLTLKNDGNTDTKGYAKAILKSYSKGSILDSQYLPVNIPKQSTIEEQYDIAFRATGLDQAEAAKVEVQLESGDFDCKICSGSGKISINSWLLAKTLQNSYKEISIVEHQYTPAAYLPPDIEDGEIIYIPPPESASPALLSQDQNSYNGGD